MDTSYCQWKRERNKKWETEKVRKRTCNEYDVGV